MDCRFRVSLVLNPGYYRHRWSYSVIARLDRAIQYTSAGGYWIAR